MALTGQARSLPICLHMLAYNLKRLIGILGFAKTMKAVVSAVT
jgi:hypothetical protein